MATALATLPCNGRVRAGDETLTAAWGAGAATAAATGLAAAGLAAGLLSGLGAGFGAALTGACGFAAVFTTGLAAGLAGTALTGFFVTVFFTDLATGFFAATVFFGVGLVMAFFTTAFLAAGLATALTGFFGAGFLATAFLATGFFAGAAALLTTFFTAGFFAATLDFADFRSFALDTTFPFCALAVVELRVVFAISLHRFVPWRPGVIAHVPYASKHAFGILSSLL